MAFYTVHILMYTFIVIWMLGESSGTVRVELKMPRYVERGKNATLYCVHSVNPEIVYKVEWLKGENKIFQFVKDRSPPYRNYSVQGAKLDLEESNDKHIKLTDLDFSASGDYSCEVSLETPIYTKESLPQELTVILPQTTEPRITFEKSVYTIGETMVANCTTSPARPPPHIVWYINDLKVNEALVKTFSAPPTNGIPNRIARRGNHGNYYGHNRGHGYGHDQSQGHGFGQGDVYGQNQQGQVYGQNPNYVQGQVYAQGQNFGQLQGQGQNHGHTHGQVYGQVQNYGFSHSYNQGHNHGYSHGRGHGHGHNYGNIASDEIRENAENDLVDAESSPQPSGIAATTSQLSVEVSELHAGELGALSLSCVSTIPGYLGHGETYADRRVHTVTIDVVMTDVSESNAVFSSCATIRCQIYVALMLTVLLHALYVNKY